MSFDTQLILTRGAARQLDREATERCGISGIILMENAARRATDVARTMLRDRRLEQAIVVCGEGNNGGDGWAMARHLHNGRIDVTVVEVGPSRPGSDAAVNREICRRMAIPMVGVDAFVDGSAVADGATAAERAAGPSLIVDAIFGTGLARPPEGVAARAIDAINRWAAAGAPVLAVDVPSGLDADTGEPLGAAVRATTTVTFVAPKPGLLEPKAAAYVGRLVVADIGAPRELLMELGTRVDRK